METISIKLDSSFSKKLTNAIKEFNYSTKTELIRESLREKLDALEKKRKLNTEWDKFFALRGSIKNINKKDFLKWREEQSEEFNKEYSKKFGILI